MVETGNYRINDADSSLKNSDFILTRTIEISLFES